MNETGLDPLSDIDNLTLLHNPAFHKVNIEEAHGASTVVNLIDIAEPIIVYTRITPFDFIEQGIEYLEMFLEYCANKVVFV